MLEEGGHLAEMVRLDWLSPLHSAPNPHAAPNPLWQPPWPTMEPSQFSRQPGLPGYTAAYGEDAEANLLAGIMGHNLCLDLFGGPSPEEAAAGLPVHGEAGLTRFHFAPLEAADTGLPGAEDALAYEAEFPLSQLHWRRQLALREDQLHFTERVTNRGRHDRPIAWTQHVTLGPPFLQPGHTRFACSASRGHTYPVDFTEGKGALAWNQEFVWPHAPRQDGGTEDLSQLTAAPVSAAFTTLAMRPDASVAWFAAWNASSQQAFGYAWARADFPWLGLWEENHARTAPPWNGQTLAKGFEFGVSPFPESRRQMISRGQLFGVPTYRWLAAGETVEVRYQARLWQTPTLPSAPPVQG